MICSSLYRLFFILRPPVQFTRELQFYLAEFSGGTSLAEARSSGCDFELISKPIHPDDLIEKLRSL
jgi:hypothetical protein